MYYHYFLFNLGTINEKLNDSTKSSDIKGSKEEIENIVNLDNEVELKVNEIIVKSSPENIKKYNTNNNTNYTPLNDKQESNDCCKSSQNKEINNYLNNNTTKHCDIVCTNDNLFHHKINLKNSPDQNSYDLKDIECKQYKKDFHQFCQNLTLELEKFDYLLNDQPTIKHIAHLEIEASKKKELENVVAEFENKRINAPNPFLFITQLKTFINDFKHLSLTEE